MSRVTISFLLPHWSVLRAVFELMWISVPLPELKPWLYLFVVEKKPSLLLLSLSLDAASFPSLCSKHSSNWGRREVYLLSLSFILEACITGAQECQLCFVSGNQHFFVCKICLWLETQDNLFWTATGPNSDVSCFRELICKWHCSPHNLHLVSFSLKIITACVRFQGLMLCLFPAGDSQVF